MVTMYYCIEKLFFVLSKSLIFIEDIFRIYIGYTQYFIKLRVVEKIYSTGTTGLEAAAEQSDYSCTSRVVRHPEMGT